jgi:hypothetical protein
MSSAERLMAREPNAPAAASYEARLTTLSDLATQTFRSSDPRMAEALALMPTPENRTQMADFLTPESRDKLHHTYIIALTGLLLRPDRTIIDSDLSRLLDPLQREGPVREKLRHVKDSLAISNPALSIRKIGSGVPPTIINDVSRDMAEQLDARYALLLKNQTEIPLDLSYGKDVMSEKDREIFRVFSALQNSQRVVHKDLVDYSTFAVYNENRIMLALLNQTDGAISIKDYYERYCSLTGAVISADLFHTFFNNVLKTRVRRANRDLQEVDSPLHIIKTSHHLQLIDKREDLSIEPVMIRRQLSPYQQLLFERLQTSPHIHTLDELIQTVWNWNPSGMDYEEKRTIVQPMVNRLNKKLQDVAPNKRVIFYPGQGVQLTEDTTPSTD